VSYFSYKGAQLIPRCPFLAMPAVEVFKSIRDLNEAIKQKARIRLDRNVPSNLSRVNQPRQGQKKTVQLCRWRKSLPSTVAAMIWMNMILLSVHHFIFLVGDQDQVETRLLANYVSINRWNVEHSHWSDHF